jgi:hypothetical protein
LLTRVGEDDYELNTQIREDSHQPLTPVGEDSYELLTQITEDVHELPTHVAEDDYELLTKVGEDLEHDEGEDGGGSPDHPLALRPTHHKN